MGIINRQRGRFVVESLFRKSVNTGLTAKAGGGKAGATPLGYGINRVAIAASAADSVLLPPATIGAECILIQDAAANAVQVFGGGTDTIDAVATGTGVACTAQRRVTFYCYAPGLWVSAQALKST